MRRQEAERVRVAVEHRHDRRCALGREQLVEDLVVALAEPLPRLERAEHQVRGGEAHHVAGHARGGELVGRRQHLRHDRAGARDYHIGLLGGGRAERVAARQREGAPPLPFRLALRDRGKLLVDRAGAEAEVGRAAAGPPELREGVQQRPLEVLAERRLPGDAARLLEPHRRRDDRLVRAALGRQRDTGRRADQDRLRARVHPE